MKPSEIQLPEAFENPRLIYIGAEAEVYRARWYGLDVVVKYRMPKPYRIKELDYEIRTRRTVREVKVLHHAKRARVPAPTVYFIDLENAMIVMSYIDGLRTRELLNETEWSRRIEICRLAGVYTGRLHGAGMQHGDLTTANMIVTGDGRLFLIDFGLSVFTDDVEDMAVDVLLFKRALMSTHYRFSTECFKAFLEGYASVRGIDELNRVLAKVGEIERRGRYVIR